MKPRVGATNEESKVDSSRTLRRQGGGAATGTSRTPSSTQIPRRSLEGAQCSVVERGPLLSPTRVVYRTDVGHSAPIKRSGSCHITMVPAPTKLRISHRIYRT